MALATALVLAGCHEAHGGGYIGAPSEGSPVFNGRQGRLRLQLPMRHWGQGRDHVPRLQHEGIGSVGSLFPGLRLHGTVENVLIDTDPSIMSQPYVPTRVRTWPNPRGPSSRAATGLSRRICCPRRPASSPSLSSIRVSRAAPKTPNHRGRLLHRPQGWPLPPLHPSRLHRGRQHPGGQHRRSLLGFPAAWRGYEYAYAAGHSGRGSGTCPSLRRVHRESSTSHCRARCCSIWLRLEKLTSFGRDGTTETASVISVTPPSGHGIYRRAGVWPDDLLPV